MNTPEILEEIDATSIKVGFIVDAWTFISKDDGFDIEMSDLNLHGHIVINPFRLTLMRASDGKVLFDEHFDEEPQFKTVYTMLKNAERDELAKLGNE